MTNGRMSGGIRRTMLVAAAAVIVTGATTMFASVATAQEGEETTSTTVTEEETTSTTVDGETTTTLDEETTTTTVPGEIVSPSGKIKIVQTPAPNEEPCVPANKIVEDKKLTRTIKSDDNIFELTIVAEVAPCEPIVAAAVIYKMPGNGQAWPQTLMEKVEFTIDEAGTTVVTFSKDCTQVQFDVITGATPDVIAPIGEWHGPLLFPFDIATSQQWFGLDSCNEVLPTTTTPEVLGTTTIPNDVSPQTLALTGNSNSTVGTILGAAMLAGGLLLLFAARRSTAR